jgi:hypothetical protein
MLSVPVYHLDAAKSPIRIQAQKVLAWGTVYSRPFKTRDSTKLATLCDILLVTSLLKRRHDAVRVTCYKYWPFQKSGQADVDSLPPYLLAFLPSQVGTLHVSGPRFRPAAAGVAEPQFEAWLAGVRQQGIQKNSVPIGSAHQVSRSALPGVHGR